MHRHNPVQQRADSQARPSISQGVRNPYLEGRARESASEENAPPSHTTLEGRARESASEENAPPSHTTLEGRARESVFFESSITLTHP
jgi:hypothetical protein